MSAGLQAAVRSQHAELALRVTVADQHAGVKRLRWSETLYSGSEADVSHGAGLFGNGALLRAYRPSSGDVRYQTIASPSGSSGWSTWSSWSTGDVFDASCDAAAAGVYGVVAWGESGTTVVVRTSSDSGASWSSETTALSGLVAGSIGVAQKSNGDRALAVIDGGVLKAAKETGGVWGAVSSSGFSGTLTGVAIAHNGSDWVLVVTGTVSGVVGVWTVRWGDGGAVSLGTWESVRLLTLSEASTVFERPGIAQIDRVRVTVAERALSGAFTLNLSTYPVYLSVWADNAWRDETPLPTGYSAGVRLVGDGSSAYLVHPAGVRRAVVPGAAVDVSSRVVEFRFEQPGGLKLALDNHDGGVSVSVGSEIAIDVGYRTSSGIEYPSGTSSTYWVVLVDEAADGNGRQVVKVEGGDIRLLLDRWRARRQLVYSGASVSAIVSDICRRAGMNFSLLSSSAAMTTLTPSFTVQAGTSGLSAIARVLSVVSDRLVSNGAYASTRYPQSIDASSWSYRNGDAASSSEQPIGRYQERSDLEGPGFVRFVSGSTVGQAQDAERVAAWGFGEVSVDKLSATGDRATARIRAGQLEAGGDVLEGLPNPGLVELDVVSVTHDRLGLSSSKRRVQEIVTWWSGRRWGQRVKLGVA